MMMTDVLGRDRYRLDRSLGVGAMGTVHLARDVVLDRVVAVKVLAEHLAADESFRHRFVREACLAARLCHPNIVQVFDAGDDGGRPFIVMEYVDGETIAERLASQRRFTDDELLSLMTQLSAGLAHAHAEGIVHRDVKPHNILIRQDGEAKLTDFGIARAVAEGGLTEIGTVLGTAPYMAPEQAAGQEVGPSADIYALGALARHVAAGPLSPDLETLVAAALNPDPAARPSAEELHSRFLALSENLTDVAPSVPDPTADAAPTEIRTPAPTELVPPTDDATAVPSTDDATTTVPPSPRRLMTAVIVAFGLFILIAAMHVAGSGAKADSNPPAVATTTATSSPRPVVPAAADPSEAARDLASWLRNQSK